MESFFAGVFITLVLVWLFYKYYINNYKSFFQNSKVIYNDLEQLCNQCLQVSDKMVHDLEEKIKEGKELLLELEKIDNRDCLPPKNNKIKKRKVIDKKGYEVTLSSQQRHILELANRGWTVKDISEKLGLGQDQINMVLQLYKK